MASSTTNSADIGIRVFLQDAASAGLFAVDSNLGKLGQTAKTTSMVFGDMSLKLAGLAVVAGLAASFLVFGGAMVYSVQQAQGLQQALTDISLATGLTSDQMAILTPFLFNLGATSIYSLKQLADGIAVVGQFGFKTTQQIEDMAAAGVKLAEATGTTTVQAFKLLAVTMQAFQIPASQADQTAALLFYSIEHGTPNVSNLTSTLGQLGGVATQLHISLQDLIPALDTVSVGMGTASTAGAGLRYFMVNIVHPTSAAAKEMEKIGLSAFNASGQFVGLEPILQAISDKVKGLSDSAKADILGTLFNIRSGTAIKQLLTQIDQYKQGINNVSNAAKLQAQLQAAVNQVMGQLGSIIHTVVSNFQDFAALIGTQIIPILSGFLANVIGPIVVQLRVWAQDPASAKIVAQFLALGAAVSAVGLIIIAIVASPIALFLAIMLAVMAAVATVALLIENWRGVWARLEPAVQAVWGVLQKVGFVLLMVGGAIAGIKVAMLAQEFVQLGVQAVILSGAFLQELIPAAMVTGREFLEVAAKAIPNLIANFPLLISTVYASATAWLASAAATMLAAAPYILLGIFIAGMVIGLVLLVQHLGFLNVLLAVGKAVWDAIWPSIQQAGNAIKGAFLDAIKQLQPVWHQLMDAFNQAKPFLMALGQILGVVIVVAIGIIIGVLRGLINVFAVVLVTVIHVITGIIQVFSGIVQFFMGFFTVLRGIFTGNGDMIKQGFAQMGQGILNIVKGLWTAVSSLFVGAFKAIVGFVTGFIDGIVGFFKGLFDKLIGHSIFTDLLMGMLRLVLNIGPSISAGFGNLVGMIINVVKTLPGKIKDALGNLGNLLLDAGKNLIQGFINGIMSMVNNIKNAIGGMLNNVRNMFPHSPAKEGPLVDAHLWMPNLVHMLSDTAEQSGPSLKASMGRVAGGARAGLGSPAGGSGGGGAGGETYTLTVDGKALMSFFHNQLTGELQANGVGRLQR